LKLTLSFVPSENRKEYLPLLLMADESEKAVNQYLNESDLYALNSYDGLAGVMVFTTVDVSTIELKNIALMSEYRGWGLGKKIIMEALSLYKKKGVKKVIVGTANSSLDTIAFYQKAGFRMKEIRKDFFSDYPEPIFENGIRALDMVMFEMELT
jgi:ribosomal protein S18 acetylase RimI-like enzyme